MDINIIGTPVIDCADRVRTRRYQFPGGAKPALGVGWRGNSNVGIDTTVNSQQLLAASANLKPVLFSITR